MGGTTSSQNRRVLVVDDTATNRFLLRAILSSNGYEVVECENGAACVESCEKEPPNIVLLDIMMPIMDGIEACRKIREKYSKSEIAIIMVTTKTESETLPEALKVGANDYVTKPVNKEILLARVASQLEIQKSHMAVNEALQLQTAMGDALPLALVVVDQEKRVIHANKQYIDAANGVKPKTISQAFAEIFEGALQDRYSEFLDKTQNEPTIALDTECACVNEKFSNIQILSKPIVNNDGSILRLWMWRDMTQVRGLEKRVNERVRLDTVALFVGGVAHNFNNILGGVMGAIEVLERVVPDNEKTRRLIRIIKLGTDQAASFTKKLNIFSRQEVTVDSRESENLREILEAVVLTQQEIVGDRIKFTNLCDSNLPKIKMKLSHLIEVLRNIVDNAVDAIKGEGEVKFTSGMVNSDYALIEVSDTGVGIDEQTLNRIFEPFFSTKNLDTVNSVSMQGNGLGLWNVYNLIKLNGGEVVVRSQVGKGTNVKIVLPIDKTVNS